MTEPKKPLAVGDRVSVEGYSQSGVWYEDKGKILSIDEENKTVVVKLDHFMAMPKMGILCCRRLRTKKKPMRVELRVIWVPHHALGYTTIAPQSVEGQFDWRTLTNKTTKLTIEWEDV